MKKPFLYTLALALLTPATLAKANSYDVYSCWAGYGTYHNPNASGAAWVKDDAASGGHFTATDDCGTNAGDGAMIAVSLNGPPAIRGENARLRFTAPLGTTVSHVDFWRNAWSYGTGSGTTAQRNEVRVLASGSPVADGTDADGTADVPYGSRGTTDTAQHGILAKNLIGLNLAVGARSIEYRVACQAAAGCPTASSFGPFPNYFASGVYVYGAKVTVQDSTNPSVIVADTGLFSGTASGVEPVTVHEASDESGVKRLAVYADFSSSPVGVVDYETDINRCDWTVPSPCQNFSDAEIPVDTTQLPDGDHSFIVRAFDAADNEKASSIHYATIKNAADQPAPVDPGPTDPTPTDPTPTEPIRVDPGQADGTGLLNGVSEGTNSGGPAATGGPKLLVTFDRNGKPSVTAKYGRMVTVRGHLTDGGGAPIASAQISYSALSSKAGARVQNLGSVRTDSTGTFLLNVATKLGSRQLRFGYSPQLGGPVAVTAQVRLDVVPPVSLRIAPRYVDNHQAVVFRGRLAAGPIPRKGKLVNLQVIVDGHWHTFATLRTSKSGRFKYRYRFMRTYGRVTYRFRARSRYEAAYPFVAGSSRTVAVHVNTCPCE